MASDVVARLETFDILYTFHPLNVAKLLTLKVSPVYWPTLYLTQTLQVSAKYITQNLKTELENISFQHVNIH